VSRRTLCVNLAILCTWWPTEEARGRAARADREFINPDHSRYGRWKYYSLAGPKSWRPGTVLQMRRNFGMIRNLLRDAGVTTLAVPVPALALPVPELPNSTISASVSYALPKKESIVDILLRASALSGDRRHTRYLRRRTALESRGKGGVG